MQYNECEVCGANNGRAGMLISRNGKEPSACLNCNDTRKEGKLVLHSNLSRTDEEIRLMVKTLLDG